MGSIYKRAGHRHWQMQYKDANGRRIRESSGTTDKASANQLLVARERVIAQIKAGTRGVNDDQFAEFAKQPIQDWINAFEQSMRIEHGQNSGHVDDTKSKIEKVCTGLAYGSGLNSDWLARYTSTRQRDDKLSARTIQSYVVAMKAFSKWCVHTGRLRIGIGYGLAGQRARQPDAFNVGFGWADEVSNVAQLEHEKQQTSRAIANASPH
jgi:hypothetical protein